MLDWTLCVVFISFFHRLHHFTSPHNTLRHSIAHHITVLHISLTMRHSTRPRPSKLAITLSFFFLQTLSLPAPTTALEERAWRPDSELPGAKFVLGDGKAQGSKVKGYEGEWPLWSSLRTSKPALDSIDAVAPAGRPGPSSSSSSSTTSSTGSNDSISYVCAPIGECEACPDDVVSPFPSFALFLTENSIGELMKLY